MSRKKEKAERKKLLAIFLVGILASILLYLGTGEYSRYHLGGLIGALAFGAAAMAALFIFYYKRRRKSGDSISTAIKKAWIELVKL